MIHVRAFLLSLIFCGASFAGQSPANPTAPIDWPAFLGRQDLVWAANPTVWEEAPFIGNGNLGATIYLHEDALAWEVNRADFAHNGSRYPMGHLALRIAGKLTGGDARLDLWNAEARGTANTDHGMVRWRTFAATDPAVIGIELEGNGGELDTGLAWTPASSLPPDKLARKQPISASDHEAGAVVKQTAAGFTNVQAFKTGDAFAVELRLAARTGAKRMYFLAIGTGPTAEAALADAARPLDRAAEIGVAAVVEGHRHWWHSYYPASFVSFPDARLEAFYWIQIYKLGSAMRANGPILDLMGPWYRKSPWLRIWFNLNVQLTYSPLFTANRLPQSESLFHALDTHTKALIENTPAPLRPNAAVIGRSASYDLVRPIDLGDRKRSEAGSEAGNLPWTMYYYWEYARYADDVTILRDRVFPLLKLSIGHYLAYLEKGADGKYHLPPTLSPELAMVPDCTYDLSLLRWGCSTLVETCERLHIDDPLLPRWRDVLANLTPLPVDNTGLMIGRDRPLRESHRHYSHLLGIYPLHLLTPERPADRALIEKSLAHWTSMPEKFRGFSYTGASSMHALLGHGDEAVDYLHQLLDRVIKPNTFYTEAGPVIETPLSAATSVQELFLQSWGGKLRVFPAIPKAWRDASFERLRSEGGYLVTAVRRGGEIDWVRLEYAGQGTPQPMVVVVPGWTTALVREGDAALKPGANGEFNLTLHDAKTAVLLARSAGSVLPAVAPVATSAESENPYPQHYK